jgi:predicted ATPase/class 3 adenylate cyclase
MTPESGPPLGPRSGLPTGTVTFLFTDIEGSTRLLQELGPDYRRVQDDHAEIMRKAISEGEGVEIRTEGDSFFAVFASAPGAVRAAVTAQRGLAEHRWSHGRPLRVRIGMHTGEGVLGGDDYLGVDVNRAARIAAAGHGGQVLLSDATRALVEHALPDGTLLRELGEHRLKDIAHTERLHEVVIEGLISEFPALRTSEVPWNVPSDRTRFIGRTPEIRAVADLLSRSRLVTLTGSGGSGKTRLATRVAVEVRDDFADGVVFVDLAPLTDSALVPSSIAGAAGVTEEGGTPIGETLQQRLGDREILLLLDNFEQVVDAAPFLAQLLDAAPRLRVLVTSRLGLRLAGEQEFAVHPMAVPPHDAPLERLAESEAVTLFVDRARAVEPSFVLNEENAAAVAELCTRLDGLPLAIELAASRVRVLSPPAILERLGSRLYLLAGGPRDAPARHRTLAEAIRWSDELLDEAASRMLRRLSVFAGGWTLDAADAVTNPDAELGVDALDVIETLLEHGLIRRDGDRFRMLETVRAYTAEQLGSDGEEVRRRHARHFLSLAERAEPLITNPMERDATSQLAAEQDNLRAALRWSRDHDVSVGLRIGAAVWRFWHLRGHLAEGRAAMEDLLATPASASPDMAGDRARALVALAGVVYWQNDYVAARAAYEEAIEIARPLEALSVLGDAIHGLAFVTRIEGDLERAVLMFGEARDIFERLGDTTRLAGSTMAEGMMLSVQDRFTAAEARLEEASRRFVELGDLLGASTANGALGQLHARREDLDRAVASYLRSIELGSAIGDNTGLAVALLGLATVAGRRGDLETGVLLAATSETITRASGAQAPRGLLSLDDTRALAEKQLGAEQTELLWERGQALDRDAAVALAREKLANK